MHKVEVERNVFAILIIAEILSHIDRLCLNAFSLQLHRFIYGIKAESRTHALRL